MNRWFPVENWYSIAKRMWYSHNGLNVQDNKNYFLLKVALLKWIVLEHLGRLSYYSVGLRSFLYGTLHWSILYTSCIKTIPSTFIHHRYEPKVRTNPGPAGEEQKTWKYFGDIRIPYQPHFTHVYANNYISLQCHGFAIAHKPVVFCFKPHKLHTSYSKKWFSFTLMNDIKHWIFKSMFAIGYKWNLALIEHFWP